MPSTFVVTNSPEKYGFLGILCVPDERPGRGPLMGIYSGLNHLTLGAAFTNINTPQDYGHIVNPGTTPMPGG